MSRYSLPVFVAAALLAGCASAPKKQPLSVRDQVPSEWNAPHELTSAPDSLWWRAWADSRLDSLIQESLAQNFSLQAATARLEAAAAQAKIAGADQLPKLSAGFSGARRKQNFIGLPIPGAEGSVFSTTSNNFGLSADVSWELDLWGRVRSGKSAALAEYQASAADLRAARLSIVGSVSKAYFAVVEAERQVALARATVENYTTSNAQIDERYQSGLRSSLDLRLSLSNVAAARAVLEQQQAVRDATVRQLEILLGRYPAGSLSAAQELPGQLEDVPAGLPADLIVRRPDVIAAERRAAAAYAGIRQAKAALYPRFALTASAGTVSNEVGDLLKGDFGVWSLLGNVLQPVFQGGRLRAAVKLAKSQSKAAVANYALTALNAFAEVETALAAERFLRQQEAALQEATDQAIAARQLAEEQYNRGLIDLITMLEAQRRAFSNESQLISVRRQRLNARVDLYLALGGGFEAETRFASVR